MIRPPPRPPLFPYTTLFRSRGSLEDQLTWRPVEETAPPQFQPRLAAPSYPEPALTPPKVSFFNGIGGFAHGGREYVCTLGEGRSEEHTSELQSQSNLVCRLL